jgi:dTDP-4-dehydrorhamnose 3,5-epimerase
LYAPECEIAVAWDDPEIGIRWPIEKPVVSPRDAAALRLAELVERLPRYTGEA